MHNFEGKVLQSIDLPDRSEIGFTSSGEPLLYSNGNCSKVSSLFNAQNREIGGIELEKLEKSIPADAQFISSLDGSTYYMVQRNAKGKVTKLIPVSDPKEISNMSGGGKIPKIPGLTGAKTPEPIDGSNYGRQAVTSSAAIGNSASSSGRSEAAVSVNGQKKNLEKDNDGNNYLTLEEENLRLQTFISPDGNLLMGVRPNNLANGSIKLFTPFGKPIDIVDFSLEIRPGNVIETTSSNGIKKYFRVTHDSSRLDIKLKEIDSLPNRAQLRFEENNVEVSRSPHSVVLDGQAAIPDEEGLSTIPGTNILSFVAHNNRDGETSTEVYVAKNKTSTTPLKVHYTDGSTSDATNGTALIVGEGDVIEEVDKKGKVQFLRVKSATNGIELETINNKPVFSIEFSGQVISSLPGIELDLPGTTINFFNNEPFGQNPKLRATARKESDRQSSQKSKLIHHTAGRKYQPKNGDGYLISPGDILQEVSNTDGTSRYFRILSTTDNNVQIEEIDSLPNGLSIFADQMLGIFGFSLASNNPPKNAAQTPPAATTSGTTPIRSRRGESSVSPSDKENEAKKPTTTERRGGLASRDKRTLTGDQPSSAQRNPLNTKTTGQQRKQDKQGKQPEVKKRKGLGERQ